MPNDLKIDPIGFMEDYQRLINPLIAVDHTSPMTATEAKIRAGRMAEEAADAMRYAASAFKVRKDPMTGRALAEDMIAMRLHGYSSGTMLWKHMSAFYDNGVAVVMVVTNAGKSVMLEDDPNLFPSDTLVTQLRLLIETGDIK
jgi:hypothetical protein